MRHAHTINLVLLLPMLLPMLLLSACISTGEPATFSYLSLPPAAPVAPTTATPRVLTGPFEIPAYLNRRQLVVRSSDGRISLREQERWAEPLEGAVAGAVNDRLRRELGSQAVVPFPAASYDDYDVHVVGSFARFEATDERVVVLETVWALLNGDGDTIDGPFYSTYTTNLDSLSGPAITNGLGELLDRFAADVAAAIAADASGH